jgi:FMN reductase
MIAVVTAGLSEPSSTRLLAEQLAAATQKALPGSEIVVIELRELAHDIVNNLLTGFAAPALQRALDHVASADALIAVTPLYRASYTGLFKSFFDVLDVDALRDKPVLIAATGGTPRHSLALEHALRPLFAYLHAVVMPTAVFAATSDWGTPGEGTALVERIDRAGAELARFVTGAGNPTQPGQSSQRDPFADFTTFDQLLRQPRV